MGLKERDEECRMGMWKGEDGPITVWLVGEGKAKDEVGERRMARSDK